MGYLTVINDKGYQEYIDDVARGLEAEEQQKLAIDDRSYQVPQISIGKILPIMIFKYSYCPIAFMSYCLP